jgi:hypothetical protein
MASFAPITSGALYSQRGRLRARHELLAGQETIPRSRIPRDAPDRRRSRLAHDGKLLACLRGRSRHTTRQRRPRHRFSELSIRAEEQNRTADTVMFSHVLYQLSYLGTAGPQITRTNFKE